MGNDSAKGSVGSDPASWTTVTYVSGGTTRVGVAVASDSGAYVAVDDGSFVPAIPGGRGDVTMFGTRLVHVDTTRINYKAMPNGGVKNLSATLSKGINIDCETKAETGGGQGGDPNVPTKGTVCAVHGGRLVVGHNNVLYFSEIGSFTNPNTTQCIVNPDYNAVTNPTVPLEIQSRDNNDKLIYLGGSWDYSRTDRAAPWKSGGSNATINEPIVSLIPHSHNCLIVGGTNQLQVVRGNPIALHGEIDTLSYTDSPIDNGAWCKGANGWTYFIGNDGLYGFPGGCPNTEPHSISRETLPDRLAGLSAENGDKATVGYDQRWRGLHIYVSRKSGGAFPVLDRDYYFYSLVKGQEGFWPMHTNRDYRLAVNYKSAVSSTESSMLAIDRSGTCYQFTKDSNEGFHSVMWLGPIKLGRSGSEGMISEIASVVAEDSDTISWGIYAADSAEEAFAMDARPKENNHRDASFKGDKWTTTGKQYVQNPCVAGQSAFIKLSSSGDFRISWDKISVRVRETGWERVG
jgi:hypothetical protein